MRILSIIIISVSILLSTGCSKGSQINGRSFKTALMSVKGLKNRLPQEQRVAFELSFWAIHDQYKQNNAEFLDQVDGKSPEALIELGKSVFEKRKLEGFKEYQQYATWDDMIRKYTQERLDQLSKKPKADPRDKDNNVIYKL
ncbi:MAG: hypothetical protein RQ733_04950 [Methyloprofundus sp.]|nr:hypothetical protein [Methyloprofundus sp.]MDT8425304.1 hypothetical protein [Methyloprofundus sp.]